MTEQRAPDRLLVVDDDASILDLLASSLRFAGFEVVTATDGRTALEQATTDPTLDLIVLDVMMPGIDGFEVVTRLRREHRDIPVIFLTARDAPADRVNG